MKAEVVAIGTELLLGQIVDTNSSWIGEQLALSGIDCHLQTKVGDNHDRVVEALRSALDRSDAVICCGGLGPTQDDLTREAIAEVMGVPLERQAHLVDRIRAMFEARGRVMPANNERQADVPQGARAFDHQPGTAPGLLCPIGDKVIYAVPGVPSEMREIMTAEILPDLRARSGDPSVILSRTVRTWGLAESALAEALADRIDELDAVGNPTLAFLASGIEGIKVRITAKAADTRAATAILDGEEAVVRQVLGDVVFGVDDESMEVAISKLLLEKGLTIGVAESLTGGFIGTRLTAVPGSSDWFRGSIVSYATDVKRSVLGVTAERVVSEECAAQMASAARRVLDADVGIAATGVAGPAEQEGQPPGTVCFGIDIQGAVTSRTVRLPGDRERVRQFSVISLLDLLRRELN